METHLLLKDVQYRQGRRNQVLKGCLKDRISYKYQKQNGFFVFPAKETLYYSGLSSNGKDVETDLNKDDIKIDFLSEMLQ